MYDPQFEKHQVRVGHLPSAHPFGVETDWHVPLRPSLSATENGQEHVRFLLLEFGMGSRT